MSRMPPTTRDTSTVNSLLIAGNSSAPHYVAHTNDGSQGIDVIEASKCQKLYSDTHVFEDGVLYCPATWDTLYCWPPTQAGAIVQRKCSEIFAYEGYSLLIFDKAAAAYRICGADGQWLTGNWTNYTQCLDLIEERTYPVSIVVGYILFIGSLVSLVTLLVTLIIFHFFKSLQCPRTRVHKNLVIALIVHSVLLAIISSSIVLRSREPLHTQVDWICKCVLALDIYAAMASINWMFVEGLLLHSRLSFSVFQDTAPFRLYHFIGWGLPCIFVSAWVIATTLYVQTPCWQGYGESSFVWIVTGPMILALLVNAIFLANIIHVLVTKLRSSVSMETAQIRKSIKATALLFPLLGITHLLFCINPQDDKHFEDAYMITNAVLQSSQGLFVSVLYCFLNSEVQGVLRNAYHRSATRRNSHFSGVSRGRGMSTSLSHFDSSALIKMAPSFKKVMLPLQFGRRTSSSRESSTDFPRATTEANKRAPLLEPTSKDSDGSLTPSRESSS